MALCQPVQPIYVMRGCSAVHAMQMFSMSSLVQCLCSCCSWAMSWQEAFPCRFCLCRKVEDFELHKQLYKGKASLLYSASCRRCNMPVAVKVYRKARLSELNWYQVRFTSCFIVQQQTQLLLNIATWPYMAVKHLSQNGLHYSLSCAALSLSHQLCIQI